MEIGHGHPPTRIAALANRLRGHEQEFSKYSQQKGGGDRDADEDHRQEPILDAEDGKAGEAKDANDEEEQHPD